MQKINLIPMTDFVDDIDNLVPREVGQDFDAWIYKQFTVVKNYAKFLKRPLTLGMFVPCDENGNVLKEPYNDGMNDMYFQSAIDEYQKAKSKVLFEGFEIKVSNIANNLQNDFLIISETNEIIGHENKDQWFFNPYKKVEDLIPYDLTLTESTIEKIGL